MAYPHSLDGISYLKMNRTFKSLIFFLQFAPFYLIAMIPFSGLYILADLLFFLVYYVVRYRRSIVCKNLRNSFPHKTDEELKKIEKKFYQHFSDVCFEAIKGLFISKASFLRRIHFVNQHVLDEAEDQKKIIIFCGSHHGNWEWFTSISAHYNHLPMLAFYQPLSNRYFNTLFKLIRERFGAICIKSDSALRHVVSTIRREGRAWCYVIADQRPKHHNSAQSVYFLNQETRFVTGIQQLAIHMDAVLLFPHFRKKKRGHYEVELIELHHDPYDKQFVINNYARLLEENIKESPHLWLWTHRRWG